MENILSGESQSTENVSTDAPVTNNESTVTETNNQTTNHDVSETVANEEPSWYESFSDEVKGIEGFEKMTEKFKDAESLATSYINLQKLVGKKVESNFPTKDSTPEQVNEFYKKLGRPESPGDYKWDGNAALFEAGITNDQYNKIMDIYGEEVNLMQSQWQANEAELISDTKSALQKEWGDKYDQNIKHASKIAEKFGVKDALIETGVINHKPVIEMLYKVYEATQEDGIVKNDNTGYSRSEEIKVLQNQMKTMNRGSEDYKAAWDKYVKLIG
jgi:hypothetical protein